MHGIVFVEMQEFVSTNYGPDSWNHLLKEAGVSGNLYLPVNEYPDSDIKALVAAACSMTKQPQSAILEGFGERLTPA